MVHMNATYGLLPADFADWRLLLRLALFCNYGCLWGPCCPSPGGNSAEGGFSRGPTTLGLHQDYSFNSTEEGSQCGLTGSGRAGSGGSSGSGGATEALREADLVVRYGA